MTEKTKVPALPAGEEAVPNTPDVAALMAKLIEIQAAGHVIQREQLKQTRKPSNARPPEISVYNPRGQKDYPMPSLKCEVLMPWPLRQGDGNGGLTREEVELMNLIEPGEYIVSLLDGTEATCNVLGTRNINTRKVERLAFMGARDDQSGHYSTLYSKERRNAFPSMVATLKEILAQQGVDTSTVMTMKEEMRRIALPVDDPKHLAVSQGD